MNNNEQISKSRIGRLLNSQTAIDFYEKMGASVLPEWRIVRITGDALEQLAGAGNGNGVRGG